MKKILLSIFTLAVVGFTAKVEAQCTVSNVIVDINTCTPVSGNLSVNFDVSFKIANNNGNKFIFIHSWKASQYPNYWNCTQAGSSNQNKPPMNTPGGGNNNTALANAFLNIAINNDFTGTGIALLNTYNPDPTNVTITPVAGISKVLNLDGSSTITLTGVQVTIPGVTSCLDPLSVISDVWSSQAAAGQVVHCVNCNIVTYFNDPIISGIVPCFNPRKVNFALTSTRLNTSFNYKIYQDDGDGVFEGGGQDINVTIGTPTVTTDGSGNVALATYSIVQPPAGSTLKNYWVEVVAVGGTSGVVELLEPFPGAECFPLPVDFKSFTATRNRSNVVLKWETASEINNSGFAVERNLNGSWEQVAFVNSRAANGNSDVQLTYTYTDLNNTKGITQYRIKQVDFDNKSKYTEIRSIRGLDQIGTVTVYPNPTNDGRINVVFDDASATRNISVLDMSGRTVKQINNITSNNITIDNLVPGMYSLRIVVPQTGEQIVQKVVVNKR